MFRYMILADNCHGIELQQQTRLCSQSAYLYVFVALQCVLMLADRLSHRCRPSNQILITALTSIRFIVKYVYAYANMFLLSTIS